MPARQTSQTSTTKSLAQGMAKPKSAGTSGGQKTLSKKPSDVGPKTPATARKTSQSGKKDLGVKVILYFSSKATSLQILSPLNSSLTPVQVFQISLPPILLRDTS